MLTDQALALQNQVTAIQLSFTNPAVGDATRHFSFSVRQDWDAITERAQDYDSPINYEEGEVPVVVVDSDSESDGMSLGSFEIIPMEGAQIGRRDLNEPGQ
jgi:hypothetical protein